MDPIDQLKDEWANPENARYRITYQSTRLKNEGGEWVDDEEVTTMTFRPIDYATFLAAERGASAIHAAIIEAWAEFASDGGSGGSARLMSILQSRLP